VRAEVGVAPTIIGHLAQHALALYSAERPAREPQLRLSSYQLWGQVSHKRLTGQA